MELLANHTFFLRWTVQWVKLIVLLASLLSGLLSTHFRDNPDLLPVFIAFNLAFLLLSFFFPVNRPFWQRRAFITMEMALIVSAAWLRLWFDLLMYFFLVKSCFLLSRRDVVLTLILTGVGYLSGNAWTLPQRIAQEVEKLHSRPPEAVYDPWAMFLVNLVDYLGASLFATLFGLVLVAERKSRQRAETLAREVETLATTLERTRIARDIHDSLGHTLTTLDVQLELAQQLHQRDPAQSLNALDTAKHLAYQCLQEVRRAVQTMRQPDFDLGQALNGLMKQLQQNQSGKISVALNLPQLPLQTSHQLYCIVQEGITNIQKHARASHVSLRGRFTLEHVTLELADNGNGFEPNQVHSGFGLRGMRERVQMLGGQIKIESALGQGTHISVTLPR